MEKPAKFQLNVFVVKMDPQRFRALPHWRSIDPTNDFLRTFTRWLVAIAVTFIGVIFLLDTTFRLMSEPWVVKVAEEHFAATVELPIAALAALLLVMIHEIRKGTIEVKGLGFEFKGAGAPIIMWTVCFLAMVAAIKLLWHP